jgi:hypothetical protein
MVIAASIISMLRGWRAARSILETVYAKRGHCVRSSPHEKPIEKSSSSAIVQNLVHRVTDHLVPVVRVPTDADPRGPAQFQWGSLPLYRRRYKAIVTFDHVDPDDKN